VRNVTADTATFYVANPVTGLVESEAGSFAADPTGASGADFHIFATDQSQYMANFTIMAEVHVANVQWNAPENPPVSLGYHGPMRGDVGYWPLDTALGKVGGGEDVPLAASNLIIDRSGNTDT